MKIAVQSPEFLMQDPVFNFNGYNFEFFSRYCKYIFLHSPFDFPRYKKALKARKLNPDNFEFIFTPKTINNTVDVLICFNGLPNVRRNRPSKKIDIPKIWHTMDYSFKSKLCNYYLERGGVDYLISYARHDLYCTFFQTMFPKFYGKVISVPFGYSSRFRNTTDFNERRNLIAALGAVNPVRDPLASHRALSDYINFFNDKLWAHPIRQKIRELNSPLASYFESFLPPLNRTKRQDYDPVSALNTNRYFVNDLSIMKFPPARTYEGIACGAVMIAERHECLLDLGFRDGENCILIDERDPYSFITAAIERINNYAEHRELLMKIQQESMRLARSYTHERVAKNLFIKLQTISKLSST